MRRLRAAAGLAVAVAGVTSVAAPLWFGHMRHGANAVHPDDHRSLARQALKNLASEGGAPRGSSLREYRKVIANGCGMLDLVDMEGSGRVPGTLRWEYSHLYDPVAGRGAADDRYINAREEYRDLWDRAVIHQEIGNYGKAFRFLGFCCHLLQDMAVPAHTHCIPHGVRTRTADNLELLARAKSFYLREPSGPPYPGDEDAHLLLFDAMGLESRGREAFDPGQVNEIAEVLRKYYVEPEWTDDGWYGSYLGEPYHPYHRLLPSTPRIRYADVVTLRNYLMERAASRTAQLLRHFADITGGAG